MLEILRYSVISISSSVGWELSYSTRDALRHCYPAPCICRHRHRWIGRLLQWVMIRWQRQSRNLIRLLMG